MSNKSQDELYELQSLIKAQQEKILDLTQKLEAAREAIDSIMIYENKKPSFEFYRKKHLALEKYRNLIKG